MLKQVITAAVLGVSALATLATHAALPGFYIEGQGGYLANSIKEDIKTAMNDNAVDKKEIDSLMNKGFKEGGLDRNFSAEVGYLMSPKTTDGFF